MSEYFICPNCGVEVPIKARACPECGSDEETGWSEAAKYTHLLPYKGDSGGDGSMSRKWQKWGVGLIAAVVLTAFLATQGFIWSLYIIPLFILIAVIAGFASRKVSSSDRHLEKQLYQQLLERARGDKHLVERLIDYEKQRNPDANRLRLLQNAVFRWDHDRR